MPYRFLGSILVLSLVAAPAAQSQESTLEPPQDLDGVWELVAVDGQALPLPPRRDGNDPSDCDGYGEFVGQRPGEGRLVIRTEEMWRGPRSLRWEGGIYAFIPEEVLCRATHGGLVVLRRDLDNRMKPVADIVPAWRGSGSYGIADSVASLAVGDLNWTLASSVISRTGDLHLMDAEATTWVFRRAAPSPRFDPRGFATLLGDFDADGHVDQVRVEPGRHGTARMVARLAAGSVTEVAQVPGSASVMLARRGTTWRNADGTSLSIPDRDAVLVSAEPAADRSDVTIFHIRNGAWVAWEYAPD